MVRKMHLKINIISFSLCCAILIFILISYVFNMDAFGYDYVIDDLIMFFAYSFFPILLIPSFKDMDGLKELLFKWVYIMFAAAVVGFILFYLNGSRDINGNSYSMSYGKNIVFPCLIMILKFRDERKIKDLAYAIAMIIFMVLISSRFPLLYVLIYIFMLFWCDMNKIFRVMYFLCICVIGYLFLSDDLSLLVKLVENIPGIGNSSRTISMLRNGSIFFDSSRSVIHQQLLEKVEMSPVIGYGFGGGVFVLEGEASHGFVFDCLASLGFVFGIIFMFMSFSMIVYTWWKNRNDKFGDVILLFMCLFFPTITIQESLFNTYKFWWLIAFTIYYYKSKKKVKYYGIKKNT